MTAQTYAKIGEEAFTQVILASARSRGEVRVEPDDVAVYNVARHPYISKYAALSMIELFPLRCVPAVEEMERMSFQERIQAGFQIGLRTGIDIIDSISSVLVKIGERFAEGILELEPEQWEGPIRSGYGLYLVFVTQFVSQRLPEISEVLDSVKRDWAVERQRKLKDAAYARLRERYTVEIEKPGNLETAKIDEAPGRVVIR